MATLRARSIAGVLIVSLLAALFLVGDDRTATAERNRRGASRWSFKQSEKCVMRKVNKARRRNGRRALGWDKQLGYLARQHARKMAQYRAVYHDGNLTSEVTRWRRLGQNSGTAGGCRRVFRAFMRSSGHRSNILGRWRHTGVGVVRAGGRIWVQHVFQYRRDPGNAYHYP